MQRCPVAAHRHAVRGAEHDTPTKLTSLLLTVGVGMTCYGIVDAEASVAPNINNPAALITARLFRIARS